MLLTLKGFSDPVQAWQVNARGRDADDSSSVRSV